MEQAELAEQEVLELIGIRDQLLTEEGVDHDAVNKEFLKRLNEIQTKYPNVNFQIVRAPGDENAP